MRYLLLFAVSNIAYGMEVKDLRDVFTSKETEVVFEGTRYEIDGPYCKTKPLTDNGPTEYVVTLQQTDGLLRNKKIIVSRTSKTALFQKPKIKKRSHSFTTLAHITAGATLFGAGAFITYLLMQDEGE